MLAYILEVSLYWTVFYLVYYLFLKKETFFRFNRYYLLGTLFAGLVLPLLHLSWSSEDPAVMASLEWFSPVTQVPAYFKIVEDESPVWHWQDVLLLVYWLGVVWFAIRLIYGIGQIWSMYRQGIKTHHTHYTLVEMPEAHLPFSFFHWVFWPQQADHLQVEEDFILKHELSHVRDRHSWDVLAVEVLRVFLWCSPLIYLYQRSLRTIHEYLADHAVLKSTHVKIYGHTLLRQSRSGLQVALANHFINSQLKNRITMMIRKPSGWAARFKLLYVVPALLLIALLVAAKSGPGETNLRKNSPLIEALPQDSTEPLYVLFYPNGEVTKTRVLNTKELDPQTIEKINVLKDDPAIHKYGADASKGVIEIYLKTNNKITPPAVPSRQVEEVFKVVEENPLFPGCNEGEFSDRENCAKQELLQYIYQNVRYPQAAREAGIQGMVVIRFIVEKDGSLSNMEVVREVGGGTGDEGLRVVKQMNADGIRWEAGKQRGEKVRVVYNLPIRFKLEEQAETAPLIEEIYKGADLDRPPLLGTCAEAEQQAQSCSKALLMEKIYQNITYPKDARAADWNGLVKVNYYVGVDGKAHFEEVDGLLIPASVKEDVKKVVESLGPWQPGIKDGKPLNVRLSFTIEYRLENSKLNTKNSTPPAPPKLPADFVVVGYPIKASSNEQLLPNIPVKGIDRTSDYLVVVYQRDKVVGKYTNQTAVEMPYQPDDFEQVNVLKGGSAQLKYQKESVIEIYLKDHVKVQEYSKQNAREIFKVVEVNPRFPGCEDLAEMNEREQCAKETLLNYVFEHVKYPEIARKNGIEGMVVIRFVIEKDGSMTDLEIVRDIGGGCGEAALAVFEGMQQEGIRWIPGKQRGKDVAVIYNMPVRFKLTDDKKVVPPSIANEDYLALPDFKAFPNPTSDQVEISFTAPLAPVDVILYNMEMQVVWSKSIAKFDGHFNETIRLKDKVAPGIFILMVKQNGLSFSKQIIMQ